MASKTYQNDQGETCTAIVFDGDPANADIPDSFDVEANPFSQGDYIRTDTDPPVAIDSEVFEAEWTEA